MRAASEVKRIFIYGSGENGFQAFHILRHDSSIEVVGFLDDDSEKHGTSYLGKRVIGGLDVVQRLRLREGISGAIVAIGDNAHRRRISAEIRSCGLDLINAIHPGAIIDSPNGIGEGVIIEMGACVHPGASIGDGVFVGGSSAIAHHSVVEDFALIGGGVIFGGHVHIGDETLIGVGCSLLPGVRVGRNSVIGIGSAIVRDIPDNVVAMGVPAKVVRQRVS